MSRERLTDEERQLIIEQALEKYEMYAGDEIRKLLRIHDQLEHELLESYEDNRELRARNREIEGT